MQQNRLSRRSFLQLSGMAAIGAGLAACSAAAPGQQAGTQGSQPAATGNKEFIMWGLQYDPHVDRYHALADAFFKKTENKANIQPQAWPLETKLLASITAGTQ